MGEWNRAVSDLQCPKCPAMNRPGATIIVIEDGEYKCCCCGHAWKVEK